MRNSVAQYPAAVVVSYKSNKYMFNTPSSIKRFLPEYPLKASQNLRLFFTGDTIEHTGGLQPLILSMIDQRATKGMKIYGNDNILRLLEEIKGYRNSDVGGKYRLLSAASLTSPDRNFIGFNDDISLLHWLKKAKDTRIFDDLEEWSKEMKIPLSQLNIASSLLHPSPCSPYLSFSESPLTITPLASPLRSTSGSTSYLISQPLGAPISSSLLSSYCLTNEEKADFFKKKFLKKNENFLKISDFYDFNNDNLRFRGVLLVDWGGEVVNTDVGQQWARFVKKVASSTAQQQLLQWNGKGKEEWEILHLAPAKVATSTGYKAFLQEIAKKEEKEGEEGAGAKKVKHLFSHSDFDWIEDCRGLEDKEYLSHTLFAEELVSMFPKYFSYTNSMYMKENHQSKAMCSELLNEMHGYECKPFRKFPVDDKGLSFSSSKSFAHLKNINTDIYSSDIQTEAAQFNFEDKPSVLLLGTSSKIAGSQRNTSAISFSFSPSGFKNPVNLMLDCSEGTYFQLVSSFGMENCDEYLRNLKIVFISHIHSDHNLGIFEILEKRKQAFNKIDAKQDEIFILLPLNCFDLFIGREQIYGDYGARLIACQDVMNISRSFTGKWSTSNENTPFSQRAVFDYL